MVTQKIILATIFIFCMASNSLAGLETCGNGKTDKFEQCDDSNTANGDGCSSICQKEGEEFKVMVYSATDTPWTPEIAQLPLLTKITQHGITWTFAQPARVGRFVNGDYYVVGTATISDIQPLSTQGNGRHGSMLNIKPNIQKSGFDSRIGYERYDQSLRIYPPITLAPGNKLVSSRSAGSNLACVMRQYDTSESPVASISILTSVAAPQSLDAFRPSYAQGSSKIYLSRNLRRQLLPRLAAVQHTAPLSEFEGYLRRPWVDSVFFNFDVPAEYMPSYARENGYLISFASLLTTLDFAPEQKEPLVVYLTQYGIDLYGLLEQGHSGWQAHGGHGTGRKFPIVFAGVMLNEQKMKSVKADFGEDMQTIWVSETQPAGTYTKSWHTKPETAVYGGHVGINGESVNSGWGPYEHLAPSKWKSTLGESYRRCCTSVSWVGEALAARLIPEMKDAWNHEQFFAYIDRWMMTPDNPNDLAAISAGAGMTVDGDFMQGQSWKILSGGGYTKVHNTFVDEMWASYRNIGTCSEQGGACCATSQTCSGTTKTASGCATCCIGTCQAQQQTCSQQGGTCCATGQTCSGTTQTASDCAACCVGTCQTTCIPGDLNCDKKVDIFDLVLVAQNYGKTSGFDAKADANKDNKVDIFDLVIVAQNYGKTG